MPFVFHNGDCIIPIDCPQYKKNATVPTKKPPKCGPHATYLETGTCEATCEKPDVTVCTKIGRDPGCYCNEHYVLHRGQCILATECSKCAQNEEYMDCGECERTCSSPFVVPCQTCKEPGCYCPFPFVRHNGKCIKVNECPKKMLMALLMRQ